MQKVKKQRRREEKSDLHHIAARLTQRFLQTGKKIAEKEGWVFHPKASRQWIKAIGDSFRHQNERLIVRDLAYYMAWAREVRGKGVIGLSREGLESIGDADYLDQMRSFYRRNVRTIAEFFLEVSAA